MAARYAFPRRLRLIGDQQVATRLIGHGDALLGSLMNRLTEARQRSGQETRIDQGVRYTYGTDGSMPYLTIEVAPSNAGTSATYKTAVWSPNGFVLRPATDDGKFGWGFPIVPASGGAYSPHNLAPGLNPSRWTAAGVLGEVLLTRVEGEIYPKATDITAPIMFSPDKGPKPKTPRPSDTRPDIAHAQAAGSMRAFRAECMGFTELAYGPIQVLRKDGLKLLNAHREDHGLDALSLPLRGNYSIAQNFANMCMATSGFGHYNPVFWEFYKVPGDRECHDGVPNVQVNTYANTRNQYDYTNENLLVQALEFDVVGTDINGEQYGTVVGASTVSAQVAFDGWLSSPPHRATIENVTWNGHSSFGDIGVNGFWVQSFVRKKQWIDCGNAYWFSEHEEIPPLSWDSFPQLNLAFETWPVSPHLSSVSPTRKVDCNFPTNGATFYDSIAWSDAHTVADLATMTFTTAADVTTSEGRFWRSTWYGANARSATIDADFARAMPYLTSAIYMRGRQIGIAPNAALVLGAAIQKISAGVIVVYRLHIIVHDQAEDRKSVV